VTPSPAIVAIALGSNLGDRRGNLLWAATQLEVVLDDLRISAIIETDPVDVPDEQPPYLNAAAVGQCSLPARELLDRLLQIETNRNRIRQSWRSPRTLDLDLILYGDKVLDEPGLLVPHPRFRDRLFVLAPLAEIAPSLRDPVSGLTMAELLDRLAAE
jgi:2-amino-4-hydroxy-6-hydroxymethyldihydropteridine diphosphokinase